MSRHRDLLLAAAEGIARDLLAGASREGDGSLVWESQGSDVHLYNGSTGTALFFAALYGLTGSAEAREHSLAAVTPVRRLLAKEDVGGPGIGGLIGVGSLVYAFVALSRLLKAPELLEAGRAAAALITSERIAGDRQGDILLGCAGAILALLALHQASLEEVATGVTALDRASACALHLLDSRISYEGRPRAWAAPGRPPLSGFAHGTSGIAYALLRLRAITGNPELLMAAREGLAYERSLYDPDHGNWYDLPAPGRPLMLAWCYGAPGIALGRLGMLELLDDLDIGSELEVALTSTKVLALSREDHLCCGNLGRADILLEASHRLKRADLLRAALSLGVGALGRAEKRNGYGLPDVADGGFPPSLFKGLAGIGYAFLRLAHPGALPCVLLMD